MTYCFLEFEKPRVGEFSVPGSSLAPARVSGTMLAKHKLLTGVGGPKLPRNPGKHGWNLQASKAYLSCSHRSMKVEIAVGFDAAFSKLLLGDTSKAPGQKHNS